MSLRFGANSEVEHFDNARNLMVRLSVDQLDGVGRMTAANRSGVRYDGDERKVTKAQ